MSAQNKELVRQFWKVWDAGDTDSFADFVATDVVDHQAMPGMPPPG
jgi:ketosteroid isomerase-like protein